MAVGDRGRPPSPPAPLARGDHLNRVRVVVEPTPAATLELLFAYPRSAMRDPAAGLRQALELTREAMPGIDPRIWVSGVELAEDLDDEESVPLAELGEVARDHLLRFLERRPGAPASTGAPLQVPAGCRVTSWEMDPPPRDLYPGRSDLLTARTHLEAMLACTLLDLPFRSERYSRFGERFWYLKLDGREGREAEAFEDLHELRFAVDRALRTAGVGGTVGSGTGRVYSYVDLCLQDVSQGLAVIRTVLREGQAHRCSWMLPLDLRDQGRWYGIREDTPAPPVGGRRLRAGE